MKNLSPLVISAVLISLAAGGCGATEDQLEGGWGKAEEAPSSLTFITYNAGLAHGNVALAEERLPEIASTLKEQQADVLCLQEVWTDEDAEYIKSQLEGYEHSFRFVTEDTSPETAPCWTKAWATSKLSGCVEDKCTSQGISAEECVMDSALCKDIYDGLGLECQLCLAANTAAPMGCVVNLGVWGGNRQYANEGRNGLMLFSRHPINNPKYTPFKTLLVKRGVISAQILGMDIHCTHLTSNLRSVPYPENETFNSWVDEQVGQVTLIEEQSSHDRCTVVMGDLNAGLAEKGLDAELAENFEQFMDLGFTEPWSDPVCTWCEDNPLAGSKVNKQLDHILVRNCPDGSYDYRRIMDEEIVVESDGERLDTRYSDHYGLRLRITPATNR